jgi:hypothetical protein
MQARGHRLAGNKTRRSPPRRSRGGRGDRCHDCCRWRPPAGSCYIAMIRRKHHRRPRAAGCSRLYAATGHWRTRSGKSPTAPPKSSIRSFGCRSSSTPTCHSDCRNETVAVSFQSTTRACCGQCFRLIPEESLTSPTISKKPIGDQAVSIWWAITEMPMLDAKFDYRPRIGGRWQVRDKVLLAPARLCIAWQRRKSRRFPD